ncbi:MAG: hypothetical protein HY671_11335 [Chloroflexi bacterium]|nr:hypothetical protein [Chloroflexota bacterium]
MEEQTRRTLTKFMGVPESDVDKVAPNIQKIIASHSKFQKYRIIAEVIDAEYCGAGIKKGQKLVFGALPPVLLAQESDCPACIRAVGPLTGFVNNLMDRIADGIDPQDGIFQVAECLDPGLEHGGLGKVYFKVYAQKVPGK